MNDWNTRRAEIVASARRTYPLAANDVDALARAVSNSEHSIRERSEVLNLNARQARKIATLERRVLEVVKAERERADKYRDILRAIVALTATDDGLDAKETIAVHAIAAEGRDDDEAAWRADPEVIANVLAAIRKEFTE